MLIHTGSIGEEYHRATNSIGQTAQSLYSENASITFSVKKAGGQFNVLFNSISGNASYGFVDFGTSNETATGVGKSNVNTIFINLQAETYDLLDTAEIEKVTANINGKNNLTIVTTLKNAKGKVRLKFTNGAKTYYSQETFNVDVEGDNTVDIACGIEGTEWYPSEWKVEVMNVANNSITGRKQIEYYTINDADGLIGFSEAVNEGAKTNSRTFKLIEDIDIESSTPGKEMKPIGTSTYMFRGTFDGQDHTISNLKLYNTDQTYLAMFTYNDGGTIKNTILDSTCEISNSSKRSGGICGLNYSNGTISKCVNYARVVGKEYIGGITAVNASGGLIFQSINYANIETSNGAIGGITGRNEHNNAKINMCENYGNVTGKTNVGGIAGGNTNSAVIQYSKNYGEIFGESSVGGITGRQTVTTSSLIVCMNYGETVIGKRNVGGIVGSNSGSIKGNSYQTRNDANVEGEENVGGIIGYNSGSMKGNSYINDGLITGINNVGGLIGYNEEGSVIEVDFSVNSNAISGTNNVGGTVGFNAGSMSANTGLGTSNGIIITGTTNVGGVAGQNTGILIGQGEWFNASTLSSSWPTSGDVLGVNNIGGIVGQNSGTISSFEVDNGTINTVTSSEDIINIGGIAGRNSGMIQNCRNYADITMEIPANLGGIVGLSSGGTINNCCNRGRINGMNSQRLDSIIGEGERSFKCLELSIS